MNEKKFFRLCPKCRKKLGYTNKKNANQAEKKQRLCCSCNIKAIQNEPERKKRMAERRSKTYSGKGNPFYGKRHTSATIEKIKVGNRDRSRSFITKEFKRVSARPGKLNGMYGRSVYDSWLEKYGKEIADQKLAAFKQNHSRLFSGKNNPMYGIPSPKGSGNGWSGWYKGWYFRSLKELSYMINVIEQKGYEWKTAEAKRLSIPYIDFDGTARTYRADFLLNERVLVEIKPERLMQSPSNRLKKEAAISFCEENGFEYRMIDVKLLDVSVLKELYASGVVKFNKKTKERMEQLCNSKKWQK